ncbi:MAG: response regulator transcription factor, partial [Microcystaceae cyanobacterium]
HFSFANLALIVSDRPVTVLMIDEDPIFRLGLVTWLGNQSPWQIVGQVGSPGEAQGWLKEPYPDLILLDPLMLSNPGAGWQFCQQLCRDYPTLKVCLLTASLDRLQLQLAQRRGVAGYFPKGIHPPELLTGLERILQGETVWSEALVTRPVSLNRRDRWLLSLFRSGLAQIDTSLEHIEQYLS